MMSHTLVHEVLVVTMHENPGTDSRADPVARISDLVHAYRPASVVIVLAQPAPAPAALSVVLRAHTLCSRLDLVMSVATHSAPVRRFLAAGADAAADIRLVIHARADIAIATATALTAA